MQIDGAGGAVIIDVGVEIEPGVEKHRERAVAGFVHGQALGRKKGVVNQALAIDGTGMDAAHVGVARDVVEVVEGENAAGQRLEKAHPFGFAVIFLAVFLDRKRDVLRAQFFAGWRRRRSGCGAVVG